MIILDRKLINCKESAIKWKLNLSWDCSRVASVVKNNGIASRRRLSFLSGENLVDEGTSLILLFHPSKLPI